MKRRCQGNKTKRLDQLGFTIVELLIATVIFSVVLIVLTEGVLQITRTYYKGITESRTQTTARDIITNLSQAVQFNKGHGFLPLLPSADGSSLGFCIGGVRYSYRLGYQLSATPSASAFQSYHVLVTDTGIISCLDTNDRAQPLDVSNLAPGSTELMGLNMRLSNIVPPTLAYLTSTELYKVEARVVYGPDDVLCSPSHSPNDCGTTVDNFANDYGPNHDIPTDLTCKGQAGSQFCAVSDLSTIIDKRLQ